MSKIFEWNERLGKAIGESVKGVPGVIIHVLILLIIFGVIAALISWIFQFLLTYVVWLIPIIVGAAAVIIIVYLSMKAYHWYKR